MESMRDRINSKDDSIGYARETAKKNFISQNNKEFKEINDVIRTITLQLQDLERLDNQVKVKELKVVEKKSKQPDLKALKNYSKNIGNVIKEAKKGLKKVSAQKRTTGRTSKWAPFQTSLDTSVKDTKIVGKQWVAGERNHAYSHPENQTPLTATQIAGYLYKGPRGKAGYSQDYGTMFHRLIEEYEKGIAKIGGSGSVTRKDIEEYLKNTYGPGKPLSAQDLADGAAYLKYGKAAECTDAMLKNFNQYLELRKIQSQMFAGKKVKAEQALGATVNYKGHKIPVAGTVDQIVGSMITDLKTSKEVGPQYVAQLSILKYIAEANGIDTKGLKIFHTPLLGSNAKVLDINPLSKKEVETLMAIAYQQETGTNLGFTPDQIKKELAAIEKHSQQLIGGGTSIYQPEAGGDYYRSAVFNGKTLAQ